MAGLDGVSVFCRPGIGGSGDPRGALESCHRYGGAPLYGLAVTYARANRKAEAREVIEALEAYRRDHYYPVEFIANAYASLGEMDRAFEWMNRVFETRSFVWSFLSQGADWEPLRRDPRWAALKKRAGSS